MRKDIDFHVRPPFPLVVAHRGARGHAPENTLASAVLGHAAEADLWELDVNYTKDGQLVVIHDDTLTRTTNAEKAFPGRPSYRVCDFTLEEIKSLDAGSWYAGRDPFGRVAAGDVDEAALKSFEGLTVPTLEEALRLTRDKGWRVNVEIKDHARLVGHETVTRDVLDLIRRLDMPELVLISSFRHRYLEECRALCPGMATGALVERLRPADPVALCRRLEVNAYHPGRDILAPGDLAALRDAGFAVNVWTVNDMDEARRLVAEGASGIITDFPAACRKALGRLSPR